MLENEQTRPYVLIVDDDADISSGIDAFLRNANYETAIARSGVEAEQAIKVRKPDIITLDVQMPEMTGLEFLEKMNKTQLLAGTKIILISGMPADELMTGLVSGVDWILEKPIQFNDVVEKVGELLNAA